MSHDKIRAAARKRMAETGEPYATARREVIKNYQEAGAGAASSSSASWFAIDYSDMGRVSLWMPHGGVGARDAGAWRSLLRCCGFGWPISIWTSHGLGAVSRPFSTRPGARSGYTAAEGAGS